MSVALEEDTTEAHARAREEDRPWRGVPGGQRRAERREQLLRAAVDLYGERGYRNTSVKGVCDRAGLTNRYFYESFPNSEAMLAAAFERVADDLWIELRRIVGDDPVPDRRLLTLLEGYYGALREDTASARVFLVEVRGVCPLVDAAFQRSIDDFGDLMLDTAGVRRDEADRLIVQGAVGAVLQIALSWIAGDYAESVADVAAAARRCCAVIVA